MMAKRFLARASLLVGLALSVASVLDLCGTFACAEAHKYAIFGIPFSIVGIAFFVIAGVVHELSISSRIFSQLFLLMIFGACGAELAFILIQKYEIQQWCKLCVGVAATVYFTAAIVSFEKIKGFTLNPMRERRMSVMPVLRKLSVIVIVFTVGFYVAYRGAQKSEAEENIPDIIMGNKSSSLEVFILTDWFCPACRKAEQEIERTVPAIGKRAKVVFVDVPIHGESLNYTPYNLSFLVHEKEKYLELRRALMGLTEKTKEPSTEDVQKAITPLHVTYRPLSFMLANRGIKFYDEIARTYKVTATPTVVVNNEKTKKAVRLVGTKDISEAAILRALDEVSQ
ncbi:MAG TPA: thioredoxin domain-containing protein [Thermodesulfovibrionales bacterium]|nr:thioredoxin domain-containing protein [Thermodesulfovibrionales bacterium]